MKSFVGFNQRLCDNGLQMEKTVIMDSINEQYSVVIKNS